MKMGIKEFRERLGEVARGREQVQLTDRGQVIGTYTPWPKMDPERLERARLAGIRHQEAQDELRAHGIDTSVLLAEIGLSPWGEPLEQANDR
ncbi:hypothetical protein [Sphingomonas bacterium]|uniref:hypothetical protein n=1 Tax=Sphingomonas bacterium TaxID=1895847 RepID=UPI0015774095|nr:hypothetical protein [Sphingomonas bacterium]